MLLISFPRAPLVVIYDYMGTVVFLYEYKGSPCICANSCFPLLMYVSMTGSVDCLHMLTTSKGSPCVHAHSCLPLCSQANIQVNKDRRVK